MKRAATSGESGAGETEWSSISWLRSLDFAAVVWAALPERFGRLDYLTDSLKHEELRAILHSKGLQSLENCIWSGIQQLEATNRKRQKQEVPITGAELTNKFAAEGKGFELRYGDLQTFFGGLEAKVGAPHANVRRSMEREHKESADSQDEFTTPNYHVRTTPSIEWVFVTAPETHAEPFPTEQVLLSSPEKMRKPLSSAELSARLEGFNSRLRAVGHAELMLEEAYGGRLYTGPMFVKYNDSLRGFGNALEGCKGNTYVTTLHVVNSVIVKASKLTSARPIYRGIAGGRLPDAFWKPNEHGVMGGVENAFMSTTFDRDVAMTYSRQDGPNKPSVVFEMKMGMVDRGAELDWLSQYSHERECLFAPLTGLEVLGTRIEDGVIIVEARLSVNLNNLTIEQVVSKRRKMLQDMASSLRLEVFEELSRRGDIHVDVVDGELEGVTCALTLDSDGRPGQKTIHGIRYRCKLARFGSICEDQYLKLPDGDGTGMLGTMYKPGKADFTAMPPWSASDADRSARGRMADAMVRDIVTNREPEWFNVDSNFSQCVSDAMRTRAALVGQMIELSLDDLPITWLPAAIGGCRELRKLQIIECASLLTLPEELAECRSLQCVELIRCPSLQSLPSQLGKCPLEEFDLGERCDKLQSNTEALSVLGTCTTLLHLRLEGIRALPVDIGGCTRLKTLCISSTVGYMTSGRATGPGILESLSESLGSCIALEELDLQGLSLHSLPDSLRRCTALRSLNLYRCGRLSRTLPDWIWARICTTSLEVTLPLEFMPPAIADQPGRGSSGESKVIADQFVYWCRWDTDRVVFRANHSGEPSGLGGHGMSTDEPMVNVS